MAEAVLDDVAAWFETNVFSLLVESEDSGIGIKRMFEAVDSYFHSGRRICLVGAFALDDTRDQFGIKINSYFAAWTTALTEALKRHGIAAARQRKPLSMLSQVYKGRWS